MKKIFSLLAIHSAALLVLASCSQGNSQSNSNDTTPYKQVERLARPAVNEGLVLTNASLNAFNSISPSLDLDATIPAVATVQNEAVTVLGVVNALGANAGLTPPMVGDVVSQFLPDVMRISVDDAHYGALHTLQANASRTGNSAQNEVGYTSCASLTAGAPLLCGGRKIRDDVIDITLSYIAGGAGQAAPSAGTPTNVPNYIVDDNISYSSEHTEPLLSSFPFLASPL